MAISNEEERKNQVILQQFPELKNGAVGLLNLTALQIASAFVKNGINPTMVRLVSEGNVNQGDDLGRTPLLFASMNGNIELIKLLLRNGANTESKFQLLTCGLRKELDDFQKWNKIYAQLPAPDVFGRTPLHEAIKGGYTNAIQLLIEHGANVNVSDEQDTTPLLLALQNLKGEVCEDVVNLLVRGGADVNHRKSNGYTSLWHAIPTKSTKVIETLLQTDVSPEGAPIFQKALQEGTTEILHLFLANSKTKSCINCVDKDGQTPITVAVLQGRRDCVKLLIDNGADLGYTLPTKDTVINLIFEHLPRPADFIEELLDSRATVTGSGKKFLVNLDFRILAPYGKHKQMDIISHILASASLEDKTRIMRNPLIESYLYLKWSRIRYYFYFLMVSYGIFVLNLSAYSIMITNNLQENSTSFRAIRYVLFVISGGLFIYFLIQGLIMWKRIHKQYELWLNITCTLLSLAIAAMGYYLPDSNLKDKPSWILHATSVAVLLAWIELMLLVGRLPTYGYYALMFAAVLRNVIKVLLTFSCLVIGFSLSFSIQFYNVEEFHDPWRSLVKTSVMMMGEFEYSALFHEKSYRLPETSRIIFLLFVVLAAIVLMNLMVGLAVSDIQLLYAEGHARRLEKQADFLAQYEKVFDGKLVELSSKFNPTVQHFFRSNVFQRNLNNLVLQINSGSKKIGSMRTKLPSDLIDTIISQKNAKQKKADVLKGDLEDVMKFLKELVDIYDSKKSSR